MWTDSGYAYAKASWLIGKSFMGKRMSSLKGIHTLNELDRNIFPDLYRELPGRELLPDLERRIVKRSVRHILSIVNSFSQPPKLLVRLLKGIEYSGFVECLGSIAGGRTELPIISNIGRFGTIRFDAFPDVGAMLRKTDFEHLLSQELRSVKKGMELVDIETKLDHRYYQGLIDSLSQLEAEDREIAARLIADEISIRNCLWVMRIRTYYNKSEAETAKYIMNINMFGKVSQKRATVCAEARSSLHFSLDVREDWRGWRWEKFLNEEGTSAHWKIDPRHFQNAASKYLHHLYIRHFHSSPMSVSAFYCFVKLKLYEEDLLTSVAEGLSLGISSSKVFDLLEVS
ncbi:MAG: V-type ATPase subunit [Treponema sp.]|nr:V-type ATPase subunit [Treponema sp.]MCL2236776.1 V-type ATPase subunit [Treponema sp.]